MTLEEAIKNTEKVAEQNEWFDKNCLKSIQCRECAKENRQLAEWLKDYKRLLEQQTCDNEDIATAFQFGMAFGFAKKYDEMDKAMEKLKKAVTLEQHSCNNAISRQAVLEQINCWIGSGEYKYTNATYYLTKRMQELPPVTSQPKTGHWIYKQYGSYPEQGDYHCSECDGIDNRIPAYCPNCGVKMQKVEE